MDKLLVQRKSPFGGSPLKGAGGRGGSVMTVELIEGTDRPLSHCFFIIRNNNDGV